MAQLEDTVKCKGPEAGISSTSSWKKGQLGRLCGMNTDQKSEMKLGTWTLFKVTWEGLSSK